MNDVSSSNFAEVLAGALGRCDEHGVEIAISTAINSHCSSDSSASKSIIDCIAASCSDATRQVLDDAIVDACSSLDSLYVNSLFPHFFS